MNADLVVENGVAIAYGLVGVVAIIGLGLIQLLRRRRDRKAARLAVHLVSLSISEPRPGSIAVRGTYHESANERRLDCRGKRVALDGAVEVVRGTRARWKAGVRTYAVRDGDPVIAIGVMSKHGADWSLVASPGEAGIQLYAAEPRPAPPPLWPWRAVVFLAICGGIAYAGLYGAGTLLVDVPRDDQCGETSVLRLQISAALPQVRDAALAGLARCH